MFGVEPWKQRVWVKGSFPGKTAVRLQFHAEQREGKAGEVVVVDAGIDKGGGKADL